MTRLYTLPLHSTVSMYMEVRQAGCYFSLVQTGTEVSLSPCCFISWHGMIYEASLVFTKSPATCERLARPLSVPPGHCFHILLRFCCWNPASHHPAAAGKNKALGVPIKTIKFNNCIQMKYWNFKHEVTGYTHYWQGWKVNTLLKPQWQKWPDKFHGWIKGFYFLNEISGLGLNVCP